MGKVIGIPFSLGRGDRVDPKLAPLGVLAVAKNLRVRKDGRLSSRTGYVAVPMTSSAGTLVAYDLHEYQDRLLVLGSDTGDAQPADVFERTSLANFEWRGSDVSKNQALTPFTNPREVGGIPQLGTGALQLTSAAGAGFVCTVWQLAESADTYVMVCRAGNGQTVHQEKVAIANGSAQVCFSVDTFYLQLTQSSGNIDILQFKPGTHGAFTAYVARAVAGTVGQRHDIVPVTNATTARVASAVNDTGAGATSIKAFNAAGVQVGGTATVVQTASVVCVDADQADNTFNLYTVSGGNVGQIRTFNFTTGALTLGATATVVGTSGSMCRLPTLGANVQAIAVAVNTAAGDVALQTFSQSAHASLATWTLQRCGLRTRLVNGQSGTQKRAVVFGGLVAPAFPTLTDPVSGSTLASNALFYSSVTVAHMSTRDLGAALDPTALSSVVPNMSLDASLGKLCWSSCAGTQLALGGSAARQPMATLVDFNSAARRQSARFGGLLYFTGATVQVYDGRFPQELLYNELPGIASVVPAAAGGSLIPGGTYSYTHHWEYVCADNSLQQSAPSEIINVTMGAGQNRNTITVSGLHSIRVALGLSLFGGSLVSVLSRTVWDVLTGTQQSELRRCQVIQAPNGMANYGAPLVILDGSTDASVATQGFLYTQGQRGDLSGPVENDAPEGCSFMAATENRMLNGGLVRPFELQMSKLAFLGEVFEYSGLSQFYGLSSEAIVGIATQDGYRLIFTNNHILAFGSGGPDDIGAGSVPYPVRYPTPSGLKSWTSFLMGPDGLYFQLDDTKLEQLPRGGGSPAWVGVDVQDTLTAFPSIIGTALCRFDDTAVFAATAATDARILVRSLRTGIWSEDTPPLTASRGIEALVGISPTVAYISGGVVFVQSSTAFSDNGAVILTQWKTNPIYPFELGGNGTADGFLLVAEFRSQGTLALRVSYDDGASFVTYDSFLLSGLAVGSTVKKKWDIQQADVTSLVFEVTYTPSFVGEGLIVQRGALLVNAAPGELEDLDAADCA